MFLMISILKFLYVYQKYNFIVYKKEQLWIIDKTIINTIENIKSINNITINELYVLKNNTKISIGDIKNGITA